MTVCQKQVLGDFIAAAYHRVIAELAEHPDPTSTEQAAGCFDRQRAVLNQRIEQLTHAGILVHRIGGTNHAKLFVRVRAVLPRQAVARRESLFGYSASAASS